MRESPYTSAVASLACTPPAGAGVPAGQTASGVAELSRLARTVRAWEAEILAFHATGGCFNGPTEAVNLLAKKFGRWPGTAPHRTALIRSR
jgi:hypothetical protein